MWRNVEGVRRDSQLVLVCRQGLVQFELLVVTNIFQIGLYSFDLRLMGKCRPIKTTVVVCETFQVSTSSETSLAMS